MSQATYTPEQKEVIARDSGMGFVRLVEFYHGAQTFHPVFTHEAYLATSRMTGYWGWVEARLAEAAGLLDAVSQH